MEISFIEQLVESMEETVLLLEKAVELGDIERITQHKIFLANLQTELKTAVENAHV